MPRKTLWRYWIVGAMLITASCRITDPDYEGITRAGEPTRIVADSQSIRELLAAEENRDDKVEQFLQAMASAPGITVAGKTYCRILATSKAHCQEDLFATSIYVKVRVTTGPYRGREGWGCEGEIQYANSPYL